MRKRIGSLLVLVLCMGCVLLIVFYRQPILALWRIWLGDRNVPKHEWEDISRISPTPQHTYPGEGTLRILFLGDTSFGESYQTERFMQSKGYERSISALRPLLKSAHSVVANLETPLTNLPDSPFDSIKRYRHRGDPQRSTALLRDSGIHAVSLANNHALDYGALGLQQTLRVLADNRISWFGAGTTQQLAERPMERTFQLGSSPLTVTVLAGYWHTPRYRWLYRFYAQGDHPGVNRWTAESAAGQVLQAHSQHPSAFVVAFPHWGQNYRWRNRTQQQMAYALIDAGADLVVGHGAHMLQEIERYQDCWILYSLGNFVFNSPGRYAANDAPPFSLACVLELEPGNGDFSASLRLYPILSDNRQTDFQPRIVTEAERDSVYELLLKHSSQSVRLAESLIRASDQVGPHLLLRLARRTSIR